MTMWLRLGLGFLVLAVLDTGAHVLFKHAALALPPLTLDLVWFTRVGLLPAVYAAVACYVATFFVWMSLLRHAPVGPAFAASHLELVGTLLASVVLFHEHVSALQWAGAGLILAGIACLALAERVD